jgi:hypothetical protein
VKYLLLFLTMLAATAAYAEPCDYYFRCPYEVSGDSRQLPFAMEGNVIENRLIWRDQDVNGNQAVLCVRGGRDVSVFTNSACIEITRGEAGTLLSEPRYMPYMDGETLRFADGQEGRPLETVEPHPQALEILEAVR